MHITFRTAAALTGLVAVAIIVSLYSGANRREGASHDMVTITLTESGFVPDEIVVSLGSTVTFTNTLGKQYWPASNLHPDHSIYPAFDPKRPLAPEEDWSFTFDLPGTWRYHDHLRSYYTGIIYVE